MLSWSEARKESKENARFYQPIPFWSWNDELEEGELHQQILEQDEAGIGGYFMHARGGLRTPYMQEEWMQAIRTCIEAGSERGMQSWLYDERGWPSGFAGGLVPRMGTWYQQKHLKHFIGTAQQAKDIDHVLGQYLIEENYRLLPQDEDPVDRTIMTIYYEINPYYVDLMKEDVVKAFIDVAYEPYFEAFGNHFGKEIPGIFTDEPQLAFLKTAWSEIIPARFIEKYGYDLMPLLPLLYVEVPGWEKVRYDFRSLQSDLFEHAFTRQISAWCDDHKVQLTGHYLYEDTLRIQTLCSAGPMRHYRHMHVPGMDWLWGNIGSSPLTILQVSSAAAQAGRKRVVSEMFGGTGWEMPLHQMRTNAEWQILWGVNMICTHLQSYSIRGARKEDWPPSVFYQNPQWPHIRKLYDELTELCALFSNGRRVSDILLIHPLKSAYITLPASSEGYTKEPATDELDQQFEIILQRLVKSGLGFSLGDEAVLKEAYVSDNGILHVGCCDYRAVIIPPCITLDETTLILLEKMIENGGFVAACKERLPQLVNGRQQQKERLDRLFQCCRLINSEEEILDILRSHVTQRAIWKKAAENIHLAVYAYEDGEAIFALNTGTHTERAEIHFDTAVTVQKLRPSSASSHTLSDLSIQLPAGTSTLYFIQKEATEQPENPLLNPYQGWQVYPAENVLRLGMCSYSADDGPWSEEMRPHDARTELLKLEKSVPIRLRYRFQVENVPTADLYLAIEKNDIQSITINGQPVSLEDKGWWIDRAIRRYSVKGMLRVGENEIILSLPFSNSPEMVAWLRRAAIYEAESNMLTYETEIDALYILGCFGVYWKNDGYTIGEYPKKVDARNLEKQGLPYFCGDITLEKSFSIKDIGKYSAIIADLGSIDGGCLQLTINGNSIPKSYMPPFRFNLLPFLKEGENKLSLQLTLHCANALDCLFNRKKIKDQPPVRYPAGLGHELSILCYDLQGCIM